MFLQSATSQLLNAGSLILLHPILTAIITYVLFLVFSRLVFHPLAGFPGPKLAALTGLYEFYFSAIKGGQFPFHIEDLHDRYGQLVSFLGKIFWSFVLLIY